MSRTKAVAFIIVLAGTLRADNITSRQLTGMWTAPTQQVVCEGDTTCSAETTVPISGPPVGTAQLQVGVQGQAQFTQVGANPYGPPAYDYLGRPIPVGSYLLTTTLNAYQGLSYGLLQYNLNPQITLHGLFTMPVDSGDWNVTAYFFQQGDYSRYPTDSADIRANGVNYNLSNTCTYGYHGETSCGAMTSQFTIAHTPGMAGEITFDTAAFSDNWGTDTVQFEAILTDQSPPLPAAASDIPEPAAGHLLVLGGALGVCLFLAGRHLLRKAV